MKNFGPGELVCEVTANLELDPEIASDPEFWPRMVLLPAPLCSLNQSGGVDFQKFIAAHTFPSLHGTNV
jgi:hypothetical protein